jgi:hypothetical protein
MSATSWGFQNVLFEYYKQQGLPQINQVVYGGCSSQFSALVNNMLFQTNLLKNGQFYSAPFPCTENSITYYWNTTNQVLSWNRLGPYNFTFAPITSYVMSSLKKVLNKTASTTTYASAFSFNCPTGNNQFVEFIKCQMSSAYCTINDVLFQSINNVLNNQDYFRYLSGVFKIRLSATDNLASLVNKLLKKYPDAAQDFQKNCASQINQLVINFFAGLGVNITNSIYLVGGSSASANTCQTANNTFTLDLKTNTVTFSSGSFNYGPILQYVTNIMTYQITPYATYSSILSSRLQICAQTLQNLSLTDMVYVSLKSLLMGQSNSR